MPPLGTKTTKRVHYNPQITSWVNIGGAADLGAAMRDDVTTTYGRGPTTKQPNFGHHLRLRIGTNAADDITISASQRIAAMSARIKARGLSGASVKTQLWWQIRRGQNYHGLKANFKANWSSVAATVQGTWWSHDPDGRELTAAVINDMMIFLIDDTANSVGTSARIAVEEVYFDYIVNNQPVVSNLVLDSTTTTTKPEVTWDYTDADGDAQSQAQVWVYSSAQYGSSGFTPGVTAPLSKTTISGPVSSYRITHNLEDGKTYRIYVRAAQKFPEQADWFSAWANIQFTINLADPVAPVLTGSAHDAVYERSSLTIWGRQNMLTEQDASIEATGVGGWVNVSNATVSRSLTQAKHGLASLSLVATAAANMSARTGDHQVVAGKRYSFRTASRAQSTSRSFRVRAEWRNAAAGVIQTDNGSSVANSNANFNAESILTMDAPALAVNVRLIVEVISPGAGEQHYFDEMIIQPLTAGASFAGWGTGGYSAATRYELQFADFPRKGNILAEQLSTGGEVERTPEGFYPRDVADTVAVSQEVAPFHGDWCIKWVPSIAGSVLDIGSKNANPLLDPYVWAAIPGEAYSNGMRCRLYSGSAISITMRFTYLDGSGNVLANNDAATSVGATWTQMTLGNTTAPANTMYVKAELQSNASLVGIPLYVDFPWFAEAPFDPAKLSPGQGVFTEWQPHRASYDRETGDTDAVRVSVSTVAAQEATIYDHEIPPEYVRLYRVRAIVSVGGVDQASPWSNLVNTWNDSPFWWIKDPFNPHYNFRCMANTNPLPQTTGVRKGVHEVPGNPYPVVIGSTGTKDSFDFDILLLGDDDFIKLREMKLHGGPLLIKGPQRQWYAHLIDDVTTTEYTKDNIDGIARKVPLSFLEVARP